MAGEKERPVGVIDYYRVWAERADRGERGLKEGVEEKNEKKSPKETASRDPLGEKSAVTLRTRRKGGGGGGGGRERCLEGGGDGIGRSVGCSDKLGGRGGTVPEASHGEEHLSDRGESTGWGGKAFLNHGRSAGQKIRRKITGGVGWTQNLISVAGCGKQGKNAIQGRAPNISPPEAKKTTKEKVKNVKRCLLQPLTSH